MTLLLASMKETFYKLAEGKGDKKQQVQCK
jgi:hypothetical protein